MLCLKTLPHQIALGFACLTLACASTAAPAEKTAKGAKTGAATPTQLQQALQQSATPTPVAGPRTADFIVAVVNSEPITRNDVQTRTERVLRAMQDQGVQTLPTPEQMEIARLRAEVARLRMERDIAKKAAAYFAQDTLRGTPGYTK